MKMLSWTSFFSLAFVPEKTLCAWENGRIVAMVYWFDHQWREHTIAYAYGVATEESCRGRGICRELMEKLACRLRKQGYYGILLVPENQKLVQMYQKMKYEVMSTLCHFTVPAAGAPDPELRQITWEKYAFYRSQLLPADSVLPTPEIYRFLDSYQGFYRCSAGIFCGCVEESEEGKILRMQEFLGEPKGMFTAIVGMGCQTAKVRLRGGAPFALFRRLTRAKAMPAYFGLPMD